MRDFLLCLALSLGAAAADTYTLGPDSERQPGVPQGAVAKFTWTSKIFPGTARDFWVYVPAQYKPDTPAAVMIFQDGAGMVDEKGRWRAPVVFDNLINRREMPVTIGIFINPGVLPALSESAQSRYNRSYEYDGLSDRYARFLIDEILPEVAKKYNLTSDPNLRAIGGSSSGAICAFTAAWHRPDQFRRVLSFIGSYVNLRGGHIYPSLIRKTEPKPLRVFLQDGNRDLNIYSGNWWLANNDIASALDYAGYDFTFVTGTEAHNSMHGSAILPDALRWLWREWERPIERPRAPRRERHFALEVTGPDSDWELVSQGHGFTEGPAVDRDGNVFFTDLRKSQIFRIGTDGKVTLFKENTGAANGLMFSPDGRLFACANDRQKVVAYGMDGSETTLAEGVRSNDVAVHANGSFYFTDPSNRRVWFVDTSGNRRLAHEGLGAPNGVLFSPDHSLLYVADSQNKWVWSFQVQPNGDLANGQPFYRLETSDESSRSVADGMTVDSEGYLYVTTTEGLQVCDQPGRVVAILAKPQPGSLSNAVFGGPNLDTLYVTAGDKVFKRQMRRKGVFPWQPVKPPTPRL